MYNLIQKSTDFLVQIMKKQFHFRKQTLDSKRPSYYKPSTRTYPSELNQLSQLNSAKLKANLTSSSNINTKVNQVLFEQITISCP